MIRQHAQLLGFTVLTIGLFLALYGTTNSNSQRLYNNAIANCGRINQLRQESNTRIRSHQIDEQVLIKFMRSAADARAASYVSTHESSDLRAVKEYKHLAALEQRSVKFRPLEIINCRKEIKK